MGALLGGKLQPLNGSLNLGNESQTVNFGKAKFAGTAATVNIPVTLKRVNAVSLTPANVPAGDEQLYTDAGSAGQFKVNDDGTITIKRTGAVKTADLPFDFLILGY